MKTLPDYILNALHGKVDYSSEFRKKVSNLKNLLSKNIKIPLHHDDHMDYCPAQFISFHCKPEDAGEKGSYLFEIRYYISSKSNLFAVYVFDEHITVTQNEKIHHPVSVKRLPIGVQKLIHQGSCIFRKNGYKEIEFCFFTTLAPDCETQLDGLPANVFEALFAEIV
jgi:hypothetical protein